MWEFRTFTVGIPIPAAGQDTRKRLSLEETALGSLAIAMIEEWDPVDWGQAKKKIEIFSIWVTQLDQQGYIIGKKSILGKHRSHIIPFEFYPERI